VFSALENAMSSANIARLAKIKSTNVSKKTLKKNEKNHKRITNILKHYNGVVSVVIALSNVCAMVSVSLVTAISVYAKLSTGITAILVTTATISFLLFCEILPKNIARHYPEKILYKSIFLLEIILFIFKPLVILFQKIIKDKKSRVTEQEIIEWVKIGADEGELEHEEGAFLESAIKFDDISLEDILIPWTKVSKVYVNDSQENILEQIRSERYSRYVVTSKDETIIYGILLSKEFLFLKIDSKLNPNIKEILRSPIYIRKNTKLPEAIKIMRINRQHFSIIKDKIGNKILGIITLEDLVEQVFGKIYDEDESYNIIESSKNKFIIYPDANINIVFKNYLKVMTPKTNAKTFLEWAIEYNHNYDLVNHQTFVYENIHFQFFIKNQKKYFKTFIINKTKGS